MTGYGKAETIFRGRKLICEIRSLNSKSMDLSTRLIPALRAHELDIRTIITSRLERGKVDLAICEQTSLPAGEGQSGASPINWAAAKTYAQQYGEQFGEPVPAEVMAAILRFPDVMKVAEEESELTDEEWKDVQALLDRAIDAFIHYLEVYFMRPNLYVLDGVMEGFMKTILHFIPVVMKEPDNYEARGNIMWASSWALNRFTFGPTNGTPFMCHWIEDEVSAKYDITHGLGLAIILPHYLEYCLNEKSAHLYHELAVNVFGLSPDLDPMEAGHQVIARLRKLFFETCGLKSRLSECGVTGTDKFPEMARVACRGGVIHGFVDLTQQDAINILTASF